MSSDENRNGCTTAAIIPAYNEAERIEKTVQSVDRHVDTTLVVDDASSDDTGPWARKAGAKVLTQPENKGYIAAIKRGFRAANTDIVVTIDADGEFPPDRIPPLVRPVCEGEADMVQGHRGTIVRPSEQFLTWLAGWGGPVGDSGTGFRALRTDLAQTLDLDGKCICGIFSLEVLGRGGKIQEVPVRLNEIDKPRGIAWYHGKQFFYVVQALVRTAFSLWKDDA
ncbi:glycosyltransferase involved in cell wall biosynthesis [Salinibacter ruber]|uniref:Glycosyltransferase involved in cell wall biosynthesis n=1 Tax=Salinibacter ruber TaxID=146919 RepID=A0A9X2R5G4_9BACT|nr:glycosyltransferase family 2 protein [Salinibacter ruber]MCS3857809.1 glycosyltransferase involved in cell wall biosynthesis [Salinibacter ruber]MCS3864635.1 glycosyltransferase involved in cell wall biosynthesis [Salinibacter ruber]